MAKNDKIVEMVKKVVEPTKIQNVTLVFIDGNSATFNDVAGWSLNGDWVAVMHKDGATEVFDADSVKYARHYSVDAPQTDVVEVNKE